MAPSMAPRRGRSAGCLLACGLAVGFHPAWVFLVPSQEPSASRRQMLSLAPAGLASSVQPAAAEEEPKLTSSWPAKDGVQFLRFFEEQYNAERDDTRRTPQFIKAIKERCQARADLTVLDIGTGPFALFATVAARAGAKKVYAVEGNPEAAERARNFVAEQEDIPEGVIEVIEGFSTAVNLPERVDLVMAEVVGAFATQENIVASIRDAQKRHMKDPTKPENYIPTAVQTWTAPVSYALHPILAPPKFEKLQGQPLTLNPRDRTLELLSDPQVLEELRFGAGELPIGRWDQKPLSFTVMGDRLRANNDQYFEALTQKEDTKAEDARPVALQTAESFSGMAIWPRLILDPAGQIVVESRGPLGEHQKSHWPTLLTLMSPTPVPVKAGDVLKITESSDLPRDILSPVKYSFQGELSRA
mmetsp:Transcript_38958/g.72464  ORF Transcript_38958/g.72464 Transcript_38958/m.72464 type:complete len:416 (+) Transcript_38958:40-1287(+)